METVIAGERGQVTIPNKLRDRFGIKSKSLVVFELREDGIVIKPAMTFTVREFSDDFIRVIAKSDQMKESERRDILAKWKGRGSSSTAMCCFLSHIQAKLDHVHP